MLGSVNLTPLHHTSKKPLSNFVKPFCVIIRVMDLAPDL